MSVINQHNEKVILGRSDRDPAWTAIQKHYAGDDPAIWRALAVFALRESLGWTIDQVSLALGMHRGHVGRVVRNTRDQLRQRFEYVPERPAGFSDPDDPEAP
jgi:hypothetical protein